jgi:hypothetical protein
LTALVYLQVINPERRTRVLSAVNCSVENVVFINNWLITYFLTIQSTADTTLAVRKILKACVSLLTSFFSQLKFSSELLASFTQYRIILLTGNPKWEYSLRG